MAVPAVSATPLFLDPPAEILQLRGVFARAAEAGVLFSPAAALADTIDISETSRLLSSMAELAKAARAAEAGNPVDNQAVIDDAQRFVENLNALNLETQFGTGGLFDLSSDVAAPAPLAASLGFGIIPLGADEDAFLLTLDNQALAGALEDDPAGTANELASFALPLGVQLAEREVQSDLLSDLSLINRPAAPNPSVAAGATALALLAVDPAEAVVPDLLVANTELRRALADTALMDTLTEALPEVPELSIAPLATPPLPTAAIAADTQRPEDSGEMAASVPGDLQRPSTVPLSTTNSATPQTGQVIPPVLAPAAAPVQAVLTPDDLLSTPLEQISRMATNPTLAGAVAAFQISGDEGGRNARVALQRDLDAVNPVEAVPRTEPIGPNLANTGEQRRDDAADKQRNEWLATRPHLF